MRHLPNFLTLLNLFAGSTGIFLLFQGELKLVIVCALVSLIADLLDGAIARKLNVASPLGLQLDSLADTVSFGVLPASMLAWSMLQCKEQLHLLIISLAFIIAAATALRLAKFNLDERDHAYFYGLPSPASGVVIFGLFAMIAFNHAWAEYLLCNRILFFGLVVLLPLLMLSNLRLWSLKGLKEPGGAAVLAFLVIAFVILAAFIQSAAVSLIIAAYIALGVINTFVKIY